VRLSDAKGVKPKRCIAKRGLCACSVRASLCFDNHCTTRDNSISHPSLSLSHEKDVDPTASLRLTVRQNLNTQDTMQAQGSRSPLVRWAATQCDCTPSRSAGMVPRSSPSDAAVGRDHRRAGSSGCISQFW